MQYVELFTLFLAFVLGLGWLARRLTTPYPILFVLGGVLISFIPRLPEIRLDPELIFFLFLPPLLYIQAFYTSWRDFRYALRPIMLLAIGLVIATTVTVGYVSHWLIPDFPLSAGYVLGAIISPPDAIAASAIAQRLNLPRKVVTILEGESLINDATGLVLFKIALASVLATGAIGKIGLPGEFFYVALGGIAVGLGVAWIVGWLRRRVMNDGIEVVLTLSLLTPFASYLAAEPFGVSGVLAVVSTGFYLGWESPEIMNSDLRLQARSVWQIIVYLLNCMIFILIGLQLPGIVRGVHEYSWQEIFLYAAVINATCILVRLIWIFPGAYLPFLLRLARKDEPVPKWREVLIIGWCGMRGIVSLAAALALSGYPGFPHLPMVQLLAFSVILTTLVLQGLTLPPLIRFLGIEDDGSAAREEELARGRIAKAVFTHLRDLRRENAYPESILDEVESFYREQAHSRNDKLADQLGWSEQRHTLVSRRHLQRLVLATQRRALLSMRRSGFIGDDVMHKIEFELDLEEVRKL